MSKVTSAGPIVEWGIYVDGVQVGYQSDATEGTNTGDLYIGDHPGAAQDFKGWIKNVRISNNNRFNAAPNSGDTDTIEVPIVDPTDDANTLLLMKMDGLPGDTDNSNGWLTDESGTHTASVNGSTFCTYTSDCKESQLIDTGNTEHLTKAEGTAKVDWVSVFGTGSQNFDGTGDYLKSGTGTNEVSGDFQIEANDFVIETWAKANSWTNDWCVCGMPTDGDTYYILKNHYLTGWTFIYRNTSELVSLTETSGGRANGPYGDLEQWYHVAVTRIGSDWALYVNGEQVATDNYSTPVVTMTKEFSIGGMVDGAGYTALNGNIDEFRFVWPSGTVYTSAFVPPSGAFESDANTRLLLHCEDTAIADSGAHDHKVYGQTQTIKIENRSSYTNTSNVFANDSSSSAHTVTDTYYNYPIEVLASGNLTACYFDGGSDYLQFDDHADWDISTDWSIDAWIRPVSVNADKTIACQYEDASNYWRFRIDADLGGGGNLRFSIYDAASFVVNLTTDAGDIVENDEWSHVAAVRASGQYWGLYHNGRQVGYLDDASIDTFAGDLFVGALGAPSQYFDGHIKNLRVSSTNEFGVLPQSDLNTNIDIPTGTPTASGNTNLLLNFDKSEHAPSVSGPAYYGDGTGDYLTAADNADFDLGTAPLTVDQVMAGR
jgi:hypothetical protein